jgi:hypothetical protein
VLERTVAAGEVFFASYPKPLPSIFPFSEVLEHAIKTRAQSRYAAKTFADGIDRKKAAELTNVLRLRGVSLEMVRGRRDESEPLIRFAGMWGRLHSGRAAWKAGRTCCVEPGDGSGIFAVHKRKSPLRGAISVSRLSSRYRKANLCQAGRPSPRLSSDRKAIFGAMRNCLCS